MKEVDAKNHSTALKEIKPNGTNPESRTTIEKIRSRRYARKIQEKPKQS